MRSKQNLGMHELIGLDATVVTAASGNLVGISGSVVDETMNTIKLEVGSEGREVTVPKKGTVMRFVSDEFAEHDMDCSDLMFRPEDRIKKLGIRMGRRGRGKQDR